MHKDILTEGGGGLIGETDGKKGKPNLTYDQINLWSDYVDKNPSKNIVDLWRGFNKAHPKSGIDFTSLQKDLDMLKNQSIGIAKRTNQITGEETTTGYSFPRVIVDGKDYGRVNALMQTKIIPPLKKPSVRINQRVPEGAYDVFFDEKEQLPAYTDPTTGSIEYTTRENLNHPAFKNKIKIKSQM